MKNNMNDTSDMTLQSKKTQKNNLKKGKIQRVLSFFVIGILIFCGLQELLRPVWNYPNSEYNLSYSYEGFFSSDRDSYDVLFLGTSHVLYGISPMEIYKENHITSYNLGTSGQPIDGTLAVLKEAFCNQSPKVVVLDASSLFTDEEHELDSMWRFVMDSMPFGVAKIKYAHVYASFFAKNSGEFDINEYLQRFASVFLPIIEYHDRFDELNSNDISDIPGVEEYYTAGYFLQTFHESSGVSVEKMNESLVENEKNARIFEHNVEVLLQIKDLCEKHDAQLLLTKIPAIARVKWYTGAWTKARYEAVKKIAMENNLVYFDLLYDGYLEIDVESDFADGGAHLNYLGSKKTSDFLGDYLKSHYELEEKTLIDFDEKMEGYDALVQLALLQLTFDKDSYDKRLKNFSGVTLESTKKGFCIKDNETSLILDEVKMKKDGKLEHIDALFHLEDYWLAYAGVNKK